MIKKRIFVIEDYSQKRFIEDLFSRHVNPEEYKLETRLDLSDDHVYQRHLPEGFDLYWLHSSGVEFDAIDEIKKNQPWSKIVVRNGGGGEAVYFNNYLSEKKIDVLIDRLNGLDEKLVLTILKNMGVELELKEK